MKKLTIILFCLVSTVSFAKNWQEGDSAYVFVQKFGGMYYYGFVTVENINKNNNKAKVFVNDICWDSLQGVYCSQNRQERDFTTGKYKWVSTYDLVQYPAEW